uniref:Diamine acetyltransferase 2 n=1 Tax=Ciona intestinalis TaxID=7719 RepID=F6W881_CIOIN|nr:diamine acetyltransferase 2 [Ciona intestinalis]|eukprot:XP_002126039.1 diamine acetyltransferase 2 [Ciona intestinalis]
MEKQSGHEELYNIRRAKKTDCEEIVGMIRGMAVEEDMEDQFKMTAEVLMKDGFESDPPCFSSFVAETKKGNEVVAYTIFVMQYSTWNGKIIYLEDVFVKQNHRNRGLATKLIQKVNEFSVETGCQQFRLACLNWNKNAMRLYKNLGCRDLTEEEQWHMLRFDNDVMHNMYKESKHAEKN